MTGKIFPRTRSREADMPILALGFRPFYLLAAIFAVLALPLWIGLYTGKLSYQGALPGIAWHTHEMIFGFAPAVIAGFLLTAVRNWTGRPTATGLLLASLAALWVAGRLMLLTGPMPAAAIVDLVFLPAIGIAIAVPIWQSRNARNFKILAIITALTLINAMFHLTNLQVLPQAMSVTANTLALDVIALLLTIMAGRVIPAFTNNAIETANARSDIRIEIIAIGSLLLMMVLEVSSLWWQIPKTAWAVLFVIAAVSHTSRLVLWAPHRALRQPLLLMLPVAYAWLPISFALGALAALDVIPLAIPTHALTIGAMSGLMLAMMTRSALGHTGRPLVAGSAEISAFLAIQIAALVRVFGALLVPEFYRNTVIMSATLWTLAFAVFLIAYWPVLTRPRIDGRPG